MTELSADDVVLGRVLRKFLEAEEPYVGVMTGRLARDVVLDGWITVTAEEAEVVRRVRDEAMGTW